MPWGAAAVVGGALISSQAAKSAASESASAQRYAADQAAEAAKFRPVGISTRFGTSYFGYGGQPQGGAAQPPAGYSFTAPAGSAYTMEMPPEGQQWAYNQQTGERIAVPSTPVSPSYGTGDISSAGYTVAPDLRTIQDRLMTQAGAYRPERIGEMAAPLGTAATGLFSLGGQYLATSPDQAAQDYLRQQQNLLTPGRERALATIRNRLFTTGRGGLGVQTGTGSAPTSPELQAYYNALAQQDAQLAAQADLYGRERTLFGTRLYGQGAELLGQLPTLTTEGYGPLQTQIGLAAELERLGQAPLDISSQLAGRSATAGANVGQSLLTGGLSAARTLQQANQYSVPGALLTGFGQQLGGRSGTQLNDWFNNLMYGAGSGGGSQYALARGGSEGSLTWRD